MDSADARQTIRKSSEPICYIERANAAPAEERSTRKVECAVQLQYVGHFTVVAMSPTSIQEWKLRVNPYWVGVVLLNSTEYPPLSIITLRKAHLRKL